MRRGNSVVGVVIGGFFLVGGMVLRRAGEQGWPLGETEDVLGTNPGSDVLETIGTIWAGVGGLLLLLFLVLAVTGAGRAAVNDVSTTVNSLAQMASSSGVVDGLSRLAALKEKGLLSDEEWAQAKAMFLGKDADHRLADARVLEELHDLYRAGGLSESEFNTKKWEILARS